MAGESLSVFAYNTSDALSDGNKMPALLDQITIHRPSVAVFSEAYKSSRGIVDGAFEDFEMLGYHAEGIDQEVSDPRPDAHGLVVIVRKDLLDQVGPFKLEGRFAILARMVSPENEEPFDFIGQHGNDKDEISRIQDTYALIEHVLRFENTADGGQALRPTINAGDLNTMDANYPLARVLRSLQGAADLLPSVPPNPEEKQPWLHKKASLAQRLSKMAIGTPLELLKAVGLEDIDATNEFTLRKAGIPVKVDHILATRHFEFVDHRVLRGITVDDDVNGEPLSDHDAILGRLLLPRAA